MGGDFYLSDKAVRQLKVYVQMDDVNIDFLLDTVSLKQVIRNPNWRAEADQRIEWLRKQDVDIRVLSPPGIEPSDVQVLVQMTRHHFPFGSAIVADRISGSGPTDQRYQEVFYDNFEWAVFENAMKWQIMERNQYDIRFERVDNALIELLARDIPVRGHCLYWNVDERNADWLKEMSEEQMDIEMQRRMDYMLDHYREDIVHWDVNNEQLHGRFFEEGSGRYDVLAAMFREAHRLAPETMMFLNDFNVVNNGNSAIALLNTVTELQQRGAVVDGLGVQSHFTGVVDIDIVAKRLDVLAEMGIPIYSTELDITLLDRNLRADNYENVLRLFYSYPAVHGIILWGFWEGTHWRPDAALWEGEDIMVSNVFFLIADLSLISCLLSYLCSSMIFSVH